MGSRIETQQNASRLLQACFMGEEQAIRTFYDRFKNLLYAAIHGWIRKFAHGAAHTEDVQEVFHNVLVLIMEDGFARLKSLRDTGKISGYLYMTAYHEAGRYFHKKWREAKETALEGPSPVTSADAALEKLSREESQRIVSEFIKMLSGRERKILEYFYGEGLSYRRIAELEGLTTSNVGVMISRIKGKCAGFIQSKYGRDHEI